MAEYRVNPEQEQALARLKCAHCQSLINCDALAQAVLAELHFRYRVDRRCGGDGGLDVTDPELITVVRKGIDRFLCHRSDSAAVMNPSGRRERKLSIYFETIQTLRRRFWQWLKDQIAQDVPEADGLCEYDCCKQQCTEEEWATCEHRIHKAAGELWPESSPPPRRETNPSAKPSQTAQQLPETEVGDCRHTPVSQSTPSPAFVSESLAKTGVGTSRRD
jgi:hypothetical protein